MCDFNSKCSILDINYGWLNYGVIEDDWMYSYIDVYVTHGYDNPNLSNMETFEWEENFLT